METSPVKPTRNLCSQLQRREILGVSFTYFGCYPQLTKLLRSREILGGCLQSHQMLMNFGKLYEILDQVSANQQRQT